MYRYFCLFEFDIRCNNIECLGHKSVSLNCRFLFMTRKLYIRRVSQLKGERISLNVLIHIPKKSIYKNHYFYSQC